MKILYGVCGEGYGHSSRAKEIILHLQSNGHKVLIITYGQAYDILKKFNTLKVEGISLLFEEEKLSLTKTIIKNIQTLSKDIKNWRKIKRRIDSFNPQICISDMELLTPIISYWYNLPLISIDNQHLLTHTKLKIPKEYAFSSNLAKLTINACVSKANAFIILSFIKAKTSIKNTYIVAPILRKEVINIKPKKQNKILVYLTKPAENLIKLLKSIPEHFIIYSSHNEKNRKIDNLELKKLSPSFIQDLANCKAIIASSGFSLISEALYLKKPYFAIPLKGQFEQTFNALNLKKSRLGTYSENPDKKQIEDFLNYLEKYEKNLKKNSLNPKEALLTLDKVLFSLAVLLR